MSSILPVNIIYKKDKFTQKCIISLALLKDTNLDINDYVAIQTSKHKYICQISITTLSQACIFVDNVITSLNFRPNTSFMHFENTNFPGDLTKIRPFTYDRITVKIVHKAGENVVHSNKAIYEAALHKIISSYVIFKGCVVNCSGSKLADSNNIFSIVICETFPEMHEYGKLNYASRVELINIMSEKQLCQIEEFQRMQLGGINDMLNILKLNLIESCSRILITGPSGCGKSSFVKKFCSDINCFFDVIDGLRTIDLTTDKCNSIQKMFSSYLNMFPNATCILFIDHIDIIAPYNLKQKSLISNLMLLNIINCLKDMPVMIIAAAVQRHNINPEVSSRFTREVNLGIPSIHQRKEIVKSCGIDDNDKIEKIALMTPGFVAHDISLLIQEAINIKKKAKSNEVSELTIGHIERALDSISPSILKTSPWNIKVKPIYWKDIGGMFHIKQKLQMCIEWPLKNPSIFKKVDLPCPRGVLLYGPPGCCKTTLARGLATECKANFFAANPAQVYSPYVGESEKNITELFYQARLCAPSIIFLDELDSLISQRKLDQKSQGVGEKVLSALLNEMDGFGTKVQYQSTLSMRKLLNETDSLENLNDKIEHFTDDVIVVAATNRPDLIDDALLRPGRFDIILYVPPPDKEERASILQTLMEGVKIKNVNVEELAEKTNLFSGADLKNLYNEAAMNALRDDIASSCITEKNFNDALKKIQPSITRKQLEMYEVLSCKYGTVIK